MKEGKSSINLRKKVILKLKERLKKEGSESVTKCHRLIFWPEE